MLAIDQRLAVVSVFTAHQSDDRLWQVRAAGVRRKDPTGGWVDRQLLHAGRRLHGDARRAVPADVRPRLHRDGPIHLPLRTVERGQVPAQPM